MLKFPLSSCLFGILHRIFRKIFASHFWPEWENKLMPAHNNTSEKPPLRNETVFLVLLSSIRFVYVLVWFSVLWFNDGVTVCRSTENYGRRHLFMRGRSSNRVWAKLCTHGAEALAYKWVFHCGKCDRSEKHFAKIKRSTNAFILLRSWAACN